MSKEAKQYEVVGKRKVLGHKPGETFTAALSEDQERRLVAGGHIRPVQPKQPDKKEQ